MELGGSLGPQGALQVLHWKHLKLLAFLGPSPTASPARKCSHPWGSPQAASDVQQGSVQDYVFLKGAPGEGPT